MSIVLIGCAAFASYLLFAGDMSANEVIAGGVVAGLTTVWAKMIRGNRERSLSFSRVLVRPLISGLVRLVPATWATGKAFLAVAISGGCAGRLQSADFDYGPMNSSAGRTRRAIAILLASLAPDRFVVDVVPRSNKVLTHIIVPAQQDLDPQWLT